MRATQVFLVAVVVLCAVVLLEAKPATKGKGGPAKCKSNADCSKSCSGHHGSCDTAKKLCVCDGKPAGKAGKPHKGGKGPKGGDTTTAATTTTTTAAPAASSSEKAEEGEGRSADQQPPAEEAATEQPADAGGDATPAAASE